MSWRGRFRARRHARGSLRMLPLIAGLGRLVLAELLIGRGGRHTRVAVGSAAREERESDLGRRVDLLGLPLLLRGGLRQR